jgi:hypothetical protein
MTSPTEPLRSYIPSHQHDTRRHQGRPNWLAQRYLLTEGQPADEDVNRPALEAAATQALRPRFGDRVACAPVQGCFPVAALT